MDAKRTIIVVVAFCLGLVTAAALLQILRSPPRTAVDAIEVAPARGDGEVGRDPRSTRGEHSGNGKPAPRRRHSRPSRDRPSDGGEGAVPALPPPPAPAGGDDDDARGDSDEGPEDEGADDEDDEDDDDEGGGDD